jgi:hypothetical protein
MSLAECPQSVTSMMVPPESTSGGGGIGFGGGFCTAKAVQAAQARMAALIEAHSNLPRGTGNVLPGTHRGFKPSGNRGNLRVRNGIVRVLILLLHGGLHARHPVRRLDPAVPGKQARGYADRLSKHGKMRPAWFIIAEFKIRVRGRFEPRCCFS